MHLSKQSKIYTYIEIIHALSAMFCKPGVTDGSSNAAVCPDKQATQRLLKHRWSLICFTIANGNTILYIYASYAEGLGSLIILIPGCGSPVEAWQQVFQSFLIHLLPTCTIAKGSIVQMYCKNSSMGFIWKSS